MASRARLADTARSGLREFLKLYPKARGLVIGPEPKSIEEALTRPASEWLRSH